MLSFTREPPSKRSLKKYFIGDNHSNFPRGMLDCAAHMILSIDEPDEIADIALAFLVDMLSASRADMGFASPKDKFYTPSSIQTSDKSVYTNFGNLIFQNQSRIFQSAWHRSGSIVCDDINSDPILSDSRKIFESLRCKSILFHRLVVNNIPVGIICLDYTDQLHIWTQSEVELFDSFCNTFFGPIIGISHYWQRKNKFETIKKPSKAELEVIKLAAKGFTYKQIAQASGKSIRTIENQLRNARNSLDARNQVELIRKCKIWF